MKQAPNHPPPVHDTRYLERTSSGKWRVSVPVPRKHHKRLGTKLKASLGTDSLIEANKLKWAEVAKLKALIEAAGKPRSNPQDRLRDVLAEAQELAKALAEARADPFDDNREDDIREAIDARVDTIRGEPINDPAANLDPEFDPQRAAVAGQFASIATGAATPIELHRAAYMAQTNVKPRTRADDERALKYLLAWCERENVPPTLEAITRKQAVRFQDDIAGIAGAKGASTLNKYLNRLSVYWKYLLHREHVETNVFQGVKRKPDVRAWNEEEREFTAEEIKRLFGGSSLTPQMADLMTFGALTGARLDAIVSLKVKDFLEVGADGGPLLIFKPMKKEKKPRAVPAHPDLLPIIARRSAGKGPEDDLWPEWPAPKANSMRERSFKASNRFTEYRRSVGVDEVVSGKRRSLVNFHSFRRWFITEAERAGHHKSLIASVVGHSAGREGETLSRYSGGPLVAQCRAVVESVKLCQEEEGSP